MRKLLLCILFMPLFMNATDPEPLLEKLSKGFSRTAEGTYKTITDKGFWQSAITATSVFNSRFFFPCTGGSVSWSSVFGNSTLRSSLCCGAIGSVLNRTLPEQYKSNSVWKVVIENPFIVGVCAHSAWVVGKTYGSAWNSTIKENPMVWLLGGTATYLAGLVIYNKVTKSHKHKRSSSVKVVSKDY
jgi:hypothetical protein